jgi:hypothetical protein
LGLEEPDHILRRKDQDMESGVNTKEMEGGLKEPLSSCHTSKNRSKEERQRKLIFLEQLAMY